MKTLVFFVLLAFGFCQGSTEGAKSSNALTLTKTRKLSSSASVLDSVPVDVVDGPASSYGNEQITDCILSHNLDFGYVRPGVISTIRYDTTAFECKEHCRTSDAGTCVAINYFGHNRTCHELKTIARMDNATTPEAMTSQLRFGVGDRCNEDSNLREYYRPGSDYKIVKMPSVVDCCYLCAKESEKCRAWDYVFSTDTCYLKDIVTELRPWPIEREYVTGLGCAGQCN